MFSSGPIQRPFATRPRPYELGGQAVYAGGQGLEEADDSKELAPCSLPISILKGKRGVASDHIVTAGFNPLNKGVD